MVPSKLRPAHKKMGFFAMVGPLQVFVSSHVSPSSHSTCTPNSPSTRPSTDGHYDDIKHRDNRPSGMLIYVDDLVVIDRLSLILPTSFSFLAYLLEKDETLTWVVGECRYEI